MRKYGKVVSFPWKLDNPYCHIDREDLDSVLSAAQFLKIRGLIRHDSEDEEDLVETNSIIEPRWDTFFFFILFQRNLSHQIQQPNNQYGNYEYWSFTNILSNRIYFDKTETNRSKNSWKFEFEFAVLELD